MHREIEKLLNEIEKLESGTIFEITELIDSEKIKVIGKEFRKLVDNGKVPEVEWYDRASDNHQLYKRK